METSNRNINKFGLVDDAANLRIMINPVPMVARQFAMLTKLCVEFQFKFTENREDDMISQKARDIKLDSLKVDFFRRLGNLRSDPAYHVQGVTEARAALVPKIPSSGSDVVDQMRDAEIRTTIRNMDSAQRMATVVKGSPEMINALLDSPVPFAEFSNDFLNECMERAALEGNANGRARLLDLQEIEETLAVNFTAAERYIANPQF